MLLKNTRILVVDDDQDILLAMRLYLRLKVKEVIIEKNPNQILNHLDTYKLDLVILDMNYNGLIHTGNEGLFWLTKIKQKNPKIEVLLITAYADIELAIRSLKKGASDFLVKPWKNEKLLTAIEEVLNSKNRKKPKEHLSKIEGTQIIGKSPVMQTVFTKVEKIAPTDANVLLLGENGTGKDLLAKAIHENSLRKDMPFVKVDVGALSDTLFESELFGYKKGAFTDAKEDRAGRFEAAHGGTLFLDEIGNINLPQQARLLTVLQNRRVTPLGSNKSIPIDIRLITATNVSLNSLADEQNFRKDLIYRINTVEIIVPPLRDRKEDIVGLAKHFSAQYAEKYMKSEIRLTDEFLETLTHYNFPGNVRELQYALERAVIMSDNGILTKEDAVFSPIESQSQPDTSTETNLELIEKNTILRVIEKNQGNISQSAKELGLTRTALYRRMAKHGI
ncbi:sigma-54 dependent transcriptional regulator [Aquimarina sp. ERC-38]|uniref:sigma-54-dependent transcriptional regulator n=1 Tax=Aquimarina sp. ERC-38 TaxID=2949996 RepID=UPI00224504DF|nr:sigma-54 dependent transcriptional regulator [Aquimarina sp. ERC-38]UZO81081.1 sigma-54 dependent transcriptional regulator [Aquimarina sp. ERC-38]